MTGVKSRWVVAICGVFLVILGLIPKVSEAIANIPGPVIGGAATVMFAMVTAIGIRTLATVKFENNHNLLIVAVSLSVGLIPSVAPTFYHRFPSDFQVIFGSSITSTVIVVFLLNLFFNHWKAWPPKNTALRVALGYGAVTGVTDEDLAAHSGHRVTAATADEARPRRRASLPRLARRRHHDCVSLIAIEGCHVATCDADGTEYADGHVVLDGGRIIAVGPGRAGAELRDGAEWIDGSGCLATPGLINTHHHLYQWITRGIATDTTLFGWLTTLYPMWARLDEDSVHASAAANLAWMALTGCTTTSDHHYVFPVDGGDLLEAEIRAAQTIGLRFHAARGSMDLGQSAGGLPPDSVVEDRDQILAATEQAIDRFHDPTPESMLRIVVAPCSPFSVTGGLMREAAELARRKGVRLHTHLAETDDEEAFCQTNFGCSPAEYAESLGWLGDDVWMAHCVHLSEPAIDRFAATGTGVAHCPTSNGRLGSGAAPIRSLLRAGAPVGLGVDGAASNESGRMIDELHQALLVARVRDGSLALSARESLSMATRGGARCLGPCRRDRRARRRGCSPTWRCGGSTGSPGPESRIRCPRSCSGRRRSSICSSAAARSSSAEQLMTADIEHLAAEQSRVAAVLQRQTV